MRQNTTKAEENRAQKRRPIYNIVVIACILLITEEALETFIPTLFSQMFIQNFQLAICIIFLYLFFYEMHIAERKTKYFYTHIIFLLVSIPYISIAQWLSIDISKDIHFFLYTIPVIRGIIGVFVIINWLIPQRSLSLLVAYIVTLILTTFYASLIFYQAEFGHNPMVNGYWDAAIVWACMNITTAGSQIYGVTKTGQFLSVVLSGGGMLFFPIFTGFIISEYQLFQKKVTTSRKEVEEK